MREGGAVMLRQLKYFQSVVRRNSFSAAAEENFISQSAVSQQIQALERELGLPQLCPDAGGKVFLSEEPDPDGGL